ncbi:MAG: EamA family transporter RarD [Clostridia bacterium]|nr:EamA family transporter RarD [Clostridia bacterium]
MSPNSDGSNIKLAGVLYGALAFTIWGFLPLYWKLLKEIPPDEILAHRVFWSFIFVVAILAFTGGWSNLIGILRDRKSMGLVILCSIFIAINWFAYIWAVNSNHIVECSMGYYINPLMSVLLGMSVLKEKLNIYQYAALLLAAAGVLIITVQYGRIPWVSLILAVSFALYGLVKKLLKVNSTVGLALETAVIMPAAVIFLVFKQVQGTGALSSVSVPTILLLLLSGIATATPLLLFAKGANRVELATIGFLQYISPTISLMLGVFVYKEHFSKIHLISFGLIWAGLVVYSLSKTRLVSCNRIRLQQQGTTTKEAQF